MSTTLSHRGLPPRVGRFELLRLFEQVARPGLGLSSATVALVRNYILRTMDGDYLSGRIGAMWTQACRFAEALGLTPRSINSAERGLEQAGFIVRNTGIKGERAGDRQVGIVVWAAGINLAPPVERFAELQAKAEALELQPRAIQHSTLKSANWASVNLATTLHTIVGVAGADTFAFHAGFGLETLNTFTAAGTAHDTLQIDKALFADWTHLLGATKQQGADLLITLDANHQLLPKNVTLTKFTSADLQFG